MPDGPYLVDELQNMIKVLGDTLDDSEYGLQQKCFVKASSKHVYSFGKVEGNISVYILNRMRKIDFILKVNEHIRVSLILFSINQFINLFPALKHSIFVIIIDFYAQVLT